MTARIIKHALVNAACVGLATVAWDLYTLNGGLK